nr:MAG TPA: hypothetical protein [Caudoviricetes sp.]
MMKSMARLGVSVRFKRKKHVYLDTGYLFSEIYFRL